MNHAAELNKLIQEANSNLANVGKLEPEGDGKIKPPRPNVFFTSSVLGMQAVSHVIENQALKVSGEVRFYSAFQKFSRAYLQKSRYDALAETGNPIYVFGIPDVPLWHNPHLTAVPIAETDDTNLAQNWFLVLHDPKLVSMALVTRELPSPNRSVNAPDKLLYRNFEGFWTYDTNLINRVVAILDDYINEHHSS